MKQRKTEINLAVLGNVFFFFIHSFENFTICIGIILQTNVWKTKNMITCFHPWLHPWDLSSKIFNQIETECHGNHLTLNPYKLCILHYICSNFKNWRRILLRKGLLTLSLLHGRTEYIGQVHTSSCFKLLIMLHVHVWGCTE